MAAKRDRNNAHEIACPDHPASCEVISTGRVARIVREALSQGTAVEIDGLGVFQPRDCGRVEFLAFNQPRAFIGYVEEDYASALRLYDHLAAHGFQPWLDRKKLLPGQNWPNAIQRAIEISDFVVFLFSRAAESKRGGFQTELRHALECVRRIPLDQVYIIPARLEPCAIPPRISNEIQHVDLFPDWEKGVLRILAAMERQLRRKRPRCPRAA
jgi:hypothetical protein